MTAYVQQHTRSYKKCIITDDTRSSDYINVWYRRQTTVDFIVGKKVPSSSQQHETYGSATETCYVPWSIFVFPWRRNISSFIDIGRAVERAVNDLDLKSLYRSGWRLSCFVPIYIIYACQKIWWRVTERESVIFNRSREPELEHSKELYIVAPSSSWHSR